MQHLHHSQQTVEDDLDQIGGEDLSGSGFEAEEPETDFVGTYPGVEE